MLNAAALENIFRAMRGLRIFERFGFNLPQKNKAITGARLVTGYSEWEFDSKQFDWVNSENDNKLINYTPDPKLIELLENRIDKELE